MKHKTFNKFFIIAVQIIEATLFNNMKPRLGLVTNLNAKLTKTLLLGQH